MDEGAADLDGVDREFLQMPKRSVSCGARVAADDTSADANGHQYGILAGLTLYAVPQVLAATVPAGIVSGEQIPQPVNTDRTRAA